MAVQTDVEGNTPPEVLMSGFLDGASNEIRGTVTADRLPVAAQVLCVHKRTMQVKQIVYSTGNGAYRFIGLRGGGREYLVMAVNPYVPEGPRYNAAISGPFQPVPPEE